MLFLTRLKCLWCGLEVIFSVTGLENNYEIGSDCNGVRFIMHTLWFLCFKLYVLLVVIVVDFCWMFNDEFTLMYVTMVRVFPCCRVPGKSYSLGCHSSMRLFKKEENLEQLVGTFHMSSMKQIFEFQSNSWQCSSISTMLVFVSYVCLWVHFNCVTALH